MAHNVQGNNTAQGWVLPTTVWDGLETQNKGVPPPDPPSLSLSNGMVNNNKPTRGKGVQGKVGGSKGNCSGTNVQVCLGNKVL